MLFSAVALWSCDTETPVDAEPGTFRLFFDNRIGEDDITLRAKGSKEYDYTTSGGQAFNLSTFRYYLGKIVLTGPDGARFEDEVKVAADETKGFYLVNEAVDGSNLVLLENVPAGTYNAVQFIIGVDESAVTEGAAGGVLDPAKGAWFWNWNAGYIAMGIEGNAEDSGQEYVDWGGGAETLEGTFAFHIGGWKEVADNPNFVNNVRTVSLDFGVGISVGKDLTPNAHVVVDGKKLLDGVPVDFATTYSIHSPRAGKPLADKLSDVFIVHHVHQNTGGGDHN